MGRAAGASACGRRELMAVRPTLLSRLKTLGLALVNATMMLAIILVVLTLLLVARVQTLADTATGALGSAAENLRENVVANLPKISETAQRLQALDARLDKLAQGGLADTATAAEIAELRTEVRVLTGQVAGLTLTLQQVGRDGYQALIAAMRTVLTEATARIDAALPEYRGTE
jgi:hypothetical protein